jgi:hypothetical protein
MVRDDPVTEAEADAGTVVLGCKKGIENLLPDIP